ncbi:unnamed protein product, partial [Rotaria magnacalcarata]
EKQFINVRLQLLDQQYCLEMDRQLWQSYLDIGLQQHLWPDQFYTMAKTNDFDLCKQYVMHYMENNKKQLNHCQFELTKQEEQFQTFCPMIEISFEQMEQRLKELVDRERKYLSKRNNDKLIKFKDDISEKQRLTTISTSALMNNQENEYINRLITIREKQAEIWKEQLMLEIRIYCKFLPLNFDQLENFISPTNYSPLNNTQKAIEMKNKHYKIIQEAKRQWLNYFLNIYEIKIQEYEQQYQNEFIKLRSLFSNNNDTTMLNNIKEYINNRINRLKKDIYDKMGSFRKIILQNRQRSSLTKNVIGVSPEPYLDLISNPFNKSQWNYLSFGPSYIRVNQSAIRPKCQQETEIKNQHKDIYSKVENHLTGHPHLIPRNNPIFKQYSDHLLDYLNQSYFTPLTYKDQLISREQAQILGSIRRIIQNRSLIIRVTDKGNNFYIGSAVEFEQKATKFFSDTNAFIELSCNPFNEILDKVIQLLNTLRGKDLIRKWQYEQMMPDRTTCELAHLYFNPKTHKDGIPVRPIESTIHAATTKISKFLDKILRPVFDAKCKDTTIIDGASLITELSKYNKKGLLKSTTLFCTFDIRNLYTMLPQEETLDILMTFLHAHGYRKVKGISIDTIKKLASIILKDNVFAYGKKIYKQTTGGAMGSSLTLTLANILMAKWQKNIVEEQTKTCEFYGRYIDDIFMTWNRSEEELRKFLDDVNTWHPNIKLDYKIGRSLPFLDVQLTNNNGILLTSVYHKPAAEPYIYSSTFEAFNYERRYIKLMLLYNGYPSTFIENEFHKYLSDYISTSTFLPLIDDENKFFQLRQKLLGQPTPRQSQVALSAATADIDNDPIANETKQSNESTTKVDQKTIKNYEEKLFLHYTHEKRFKVFKRDMHHVYEHTFRATPAMYTNLIVGNRNRRQASDELIHKRPTQ